jgi:hypothetical protein
MDRRPYEVWLKKGDNAPNWALEMACHLFESDNPVPLDQKICREFERITASVE